MRPAAQPRRRRRAVDDRDEVAALDAQGLENLSRTLTHLLWGEGDDADRIAEDLRDEGFTEVRVVREALAGKDDSEDHEWAVHVREDMVADESTAVAQGLRERFAALAEEHDGWLDEDVSPDRH